MVAILTAENSIHHLPNMNRRVNHYDTLSKVELKKLKSYSITAQHRGFVAHNDPYFDTAYS
jgi:hypothetical protein